MEMQGLKVGLLGDKMAEEKKIRKKVYLYNSHSFEGSRGWIDFDMFCSDVPNEIIGNDGCPACGMASVETMRKFRDSHYEIVVNVCPGGERAPLTPDQAIKYAEFIGAEERGGE